MSSESKAKQNPFQCDQCKGFYKSKHGLKKHIMNSCPSSYLNKCMWCGMRFSNRGVLANHALKVHGDPSYQSQRAKSKEFYQQCAACNTTCSSREILKFHIRRTHFNLKAPIPFAEIKKVNQVWFEKALNDTIVEMKKTGPSKLVIKALRNTNIKLNNVTQEMVDVSHVYPVNRGQILCKLCNKNVSKKDYKKHYSERHLQKKMQRCNNCLRTFSRQYLYLKHVCSKTPRIRGVSKNRRESNIVVSSVESLNIL